MDRLNPASTNFEDLLRRLQKEGYEIKRGKYVSCRVSDQKRFTRLKTLGTDYTEDAIAACTLQATKTARRTDQPAH